ncbi:MAG TPA: hypothetical protein DEQ47_08370 [Solibacterales bacterium]|nr:hypothetical protein [Bryobacterales bacterium]
MTKWITPLLAVAALAAAPPKTVFENLPAHELANNKVKLQILEQGSSIASISLLDQNPQFSPLWNPAAASRAAGAKNTFGNSLGHFLCLDGFGASSAEEQLAGYPFHGEAFSQKWTVNLAAHQGPTNVLVLATHLPLAFEDVQRTYRLNDGEQVLSVETQVTSLLAFDRPLQWAEHATIGVPFLKPGVTVVDMSASRARTRPYEPGPAGLPHRLPPGKDFTWPVAPALAGKKIDLRAEPLKPNSGDHTTQLMLPGRIAFITMLNPELHLLLGYLFRPEQFPWTQNWEYYPAAGQYARGLEFSTQPFDVPRRQVVQQNTMFGAPMFRWLPARSKIESRFLMFYTRVPDGMRKVDDVRLENGAITIEDRHAHRTVQLKTSLSL